MKKFLTILIILLVSNISFSQKKPNVDTSEMCIPYNVAQKMLLDLNDYDRIKELTKLDKEEIKQLNNKIFYLEKSINTWEEKDSLSNQIVLKTEEKFKIVSNQNDELRKEVKKLKVKNTFISIISGAVLSTLTVFSILK
jgi:hypothetical protein